MGSSISLAFLLTINGKLPILGRRSSLFSSHFALEFLFVWRLCSSLTPSFPITLRHSLPHFLYPPERDPRLPGRYISVHHLSSSEKIPFRIDPSKRMSNTGDLVFTFHNNPLLVLRLSAARKKLKKGGLLCLLSVTRGDV